MVAACAPADSASMSIRLTRVLLCAALLCIAAKAHANSDAPGDSLARVPARPDSLATPPTPADSLATPSTPADSLAGALANPHGRTMQDSVTVLPPVRVEGERVTEDTRSTATTVKLTRGNLVRFLPATAGDALLAAPGLDLVRTGAWSSQVALRGLSGDRVLVLVDGVRLDSGRGHGAQTSLVPVERLDAIDVSPGAASAAYGSDALGGVVNLITHRNLFAELPALVATLDVRASTPGDAAGASARLRYRSPAFGAELSGGLASLGALTTPDGPLAHSGFHEDDLTGRAVGRWNALTVDAEHAHHAAHDVGIPAFSGSSGSFATYPLQARDADRLELVWTDPAPWSMRVLASSQTYHTAFDETTVDSAFSHNHYVASTTTAAADRIVTRARALQPEWQFGRRGALSVGGEYRLETASGPRATLITTATAGGVITDQSSSAGESVPPASREVWGAHAATAIERFGGRGEFGVRYDLMHSVATVTPGGTTPALDVTDSRPSVEGGLSRRIGVVEPYAHLGTGFRAPSLEERYFNDDIHGGLRLFGNPDLRAERSVTGEIGVRTGGERGALRVSIYRSVVDDLITLHYLDQLYGVPRFQYANVDRARIEGLEFDSRLHAGIASLGLRGAFPRGIDLANGQRLTDVGAPRITAELGSALPHVIPFGTMALRARWTDAVPVDPFVGDGQNDVTARPATWLLAAEAGTTLFGTRVTLAVNNLLNHRYREPLGFIDEAGRTVTLALRRDIALPIGGHMKETR